MNNLQEVLFEDVQQKLDLSVKTREKAIEVFEKIKWINSVNWQGAVGACLYINCILLKETRSQRQVALATGVSEVTIRNAFKRIMEEKENYGID